MEEEKQMISQKTKNRWDYYSAIDGAKILGREEGEMIGEARGEAIGARNSALQIAIKLKAKGFGLEKIAELTELDIAEVEAL